MNGSSSRKTGGDARDARDVRERDDVGASGMRERETTPAPPSLQDPAVCSTERPTSVPDYDVAAVALEATLRHDLAGLPLDLAVPVRTRVPVPSDLEIRESFLLLHVDGRSSVLDIAGLTGIPVDEALASFAMLSASGLVALVGGGRPSH